MNPETGKFVISLDFELYWGMFDKVTLAEYGARIAGEREAIPLMLEAFKEFGLHATWATVGMLTFDNKATLLRALPDRKPQYHDPQISSYRHLEEGGVGENEKHDPYHFAPSMVRLIARYPHQEIGSHTFSHYYCLEPGQTADDFRADLEAQQEALSLFNVASRSIVFPRNQANSAYLPLLKEAGIVAYRGTENHRFYLPRPEAGQGLSVRGGRLLDHYLNLSGHHTYPLPKPVDGLVNVPASRFLRPYSKRLTGIEFLKLRRILQSMSHAAKEREVFHLWWHPHNMGADIDRNIRALRVVARHYQTLAKQYGFESASMGEIAELSLAAHTQAA